MATMHLFSSILLILLFVYVANSSPTKNKTSSSNKQLMLLEVLRDVMSSIKLDIYFITCLEHPTMSLNDPNIRYEFLPILKGAIEYQIQRQSHSYNEKIISQCREALNDVLVIPQEFIDNILKNKYLMSEEKKSLKNTEFKAKFKSSFLELIDNQIEQIKARNMTSLTMELKQLRFLKEYFKVSNTFDDEFISNLQKEERLRTNQKISQSAKIIAFRKVLGNHFDNKHDQISSDLLNEAMKSFEIPVKFLGDLAKDLDDFQMKKITSAKFIEKFQMKFSGCLDHDIEKKSFSRMLLGK